MPGLNFYFKGLLFSFWRQGLTVQSCLALNLNVDQSGHTLSKIQQSLPPECWLEVVQDQAWLRIYFYFYLHVCLLEESVRFLGAGATDGPMWVLGTKQVLCKITSTISCLAMAPVLLPPPFFFLKKRSYKAQTKTVWLRTTLNSWLSVLPLLLKNRLYTHTMYLAGYVLNSFILNR